MSARSRCRYCETEHKPRFLCDPAKKVLDALYARGMEFNMPTITFPEPIPGVELGMGLNAGDSLLRQLVVNAGMVPVAGVARPVLLFTGRTVDDRDLPRWVYPGTDEEIGRAVTLVTEMADLAITAARTARAGNRPRTEGDTNGKP